MSDALSAAGRGAENGDAGPVVIYLAGFGRSGSTLLERILGAAPGAVNVGELIDLFRRVAPLDEHCGCGERFSRCPFWLEVGRLAYGGWTPEIVDHVGRLQSLVARQRHIPRLLADRSPPESAGARSEYRAAYDRMYRAIATVSGARYVVDASKWPAQALALSGGDIDLRLVNVVRDVHGVVHSMGKQDVIRPQAGGAGVPVMASAGSMRSAARWALCQCEIALASRTGPKVVLRYEDLVSAPRPTLEQLLHGLEISVAPGCLDHVSEDSVRLPRSHGLSGNPSRFHEGDVPLRLDEAWRGATPPWRRRLESAIALPGSLATAPPSSLSRRSAKGNPALTSPAPPRPDPRPAPDGAPESWPLVSVVVATRGRPELVRQTLGSIVDQTYPGPLQIVVVHDQEDPDEELKSRARSDRSISVLANVHSPGLAGARNTGLDHVTGEFVATCDDDDLWHPDKIESQIALLRRDPDLLAVGAGIRLLLPRGEVVEWPGRSPRIDRATLLRNRVKELHSSTLVMRRDAFAKAGRYDETLPHGYAEDYEFVLRLARVGVIGVVQQPKADIRKDVQSWFRERSQNTAEALTYLLRSHPELTTSRRGHARILGQIAFAQSSMGQRGTALRTTGQALLRYPLAPHAYLALAQLTTGADPSRVLALARRFGRGLS